MRKERKGSMLGGPGALSACGHAQAGTPAVFAQGRAAKTAGLGAWQAHGG